MAHHIVHLSSVHEWNDPRILLKECASLARRGHRVTLVVPGAPDVPHGGVAFASVPRRRSRAARLAVTTVQVGLRALRLKGDVYHFHDPELIPVGMLLRLLGKPVVYDIHEDYVTAVNRSDYIPAALRPLLRRVLDHGERWAARAFRQIIAERYYEERFPAAVPVLNYPSLDGFGRAVAAAPPPHPRLLYTGNVSTQRGARVHAALADRLDGAELHMIGRCGTALADELAAAMRHPDRLRLTGAGRYVPFARILEAYAEPWTCALAVFPDDEHYRRKELTKVFEYMAAGIPVVASDFPAWRALVADTGAGICVPPGDADAAAEAVRRIHADPALHRRMADNGVREAHARFSWRSQEAALLAFYDRLLAGPAPAVAPGDGLAARSGNRTGR
ncbi:glycosyltransferase family 4 protein [Azospirillum sp. ST 5-10]|uniref:glycosyltransferase family 4 protein n=1 Tax=unclassified Azospirillum TaxID=2630922 RepID=UPI003F49DBAD